MLIEAIVARVQGKLSNAVTAALRLTQQQSMAVAQFEGEGDDATRAGVRFHLVGAATTGIAPVQAVPTTAAQWLLYNPASNPSMIFFDILGEWLLSGTAGAGATVMYALCGSGALPATRPAALAAGLALPNANPGSGRVSKLIVASGQTLATNPGWAPLAFMNPTGTILGQTQMDQRDIRGKIALQPDTAIALAVISPTGTTPLFVPYGTYREYASDPE